MKEKAIKIAGALILIFVVSNPQAMGVSLLATSNTVGVTYGDFITLDILVDFSAEPTLGGGFSIVYDTTDLFLENFANNYIGTFSNRDPDLEDGVISAWAFAGLHGLHGTAIAGTVSFVVLGNNPGSTGSISIVEDIGGIGGAFTSAATLTPYQPGQLTFEGVEYSNFSAIPVPAAELLMLSGVATLFGFSVRVAT